MLAHETISIRAIHARSLFVDVKEEEPEEEEKNSTVVASLLLRNLFPLLKAAKDKLPDQRLQIDVAALLLPQRRNVENETSR